MSALQILLRVHSTDIRKYINRCHQLVNRHFWKNMESVELQPPSNVRGMTILDRNAFKKRIQVPVLRVNESLLNKVKPFVKKLVLKMDNMKPVRSALPRNGDDKNGNEKEILLHPSAISGWDALPNELSSMGISKSNFYYSGLDLIYENWKADEVLKSILPLDQEGLSSYSKIGHIIHINLREHLEPYKKLIGEVLMDKTVACRTVINKTNNIDNKYRNFELELICGEPDYLVAVKENGVAFEFDFSRVYWNPRLSTEHERVVNLFKPSDVLYDVFAGVGPFSVPAALKKKCIVLANDLNPDSFKWLNVNVKKNKCEGKIKTFNKDGRDFIQEDIRPDLVERWSTDSPSQYTMHIVMNLPAMAVEFLDVFDGLLSSEDYTKLKNIQTLTIHVYTFVKGIEEKEKIAVEAVESNLKSKLSVNLQGVYFVRNVAPNKDMFRVSFVLSKDILFGNYRKRQSSPSIDDVDAKRKCS